ncbi:MAG: histidine kinase [Acidobacteria bacterium]|nr:MAG: histidine kinase [Acidobacteriota bacterium]
MGARKYVGQASMKQRLEDLIEEMIKGGIRFPEAKREFEKRFLSRVMEQENGNLSRAARTLHIHRNTLSKKLQELKLAAPRTK